MTKGRFWAIAAIVAASLFALQGCSSDDESPQSDAKLVVGDEAPAFTLTSSDGEAVSLADYRGRPTLLFFHMAMG